MPDQKMVNELSQEQPNNGAASEEPKVPYDYFLTESVAVILWVAYADGCIDYCNDYWSEYTGLTAEESQGTGWMEAIHPDDRETCGRRWVEALSTGAPYEDAFRVRRGSDGTYRWYLSRAIPKVWGREGVLSWFGSSVDIEERRSPLSARRAEIEANVQRKETVDSIDIAELKATLEKQITQKLRADAALRDSDEHNRLISTNTSGVVYQFVMHADNSVEFTFVSQSSLSLFGIEAHEIVEDANLLLGLIAPENRVAFQLSVAESAQNLTRWSWEGWAVVQSGERKWITCSSHPHRRSNGDIVWDGLLMDSTEQKKVQLQIEMQRLQLQEANLRLGEANRKLEILAIHDGLTGLKNRRSFQERLDEEVQRQARSKNPLSLLLFDVDKFKPYNDTYGHVAGDNVLKTIAAIVSESVREIDFAARYGGEEFAIILPQTDVVAALVLAERVRAAIEAHAWVEREITISIGVATVAGSSSMNATRLIEIADEALYSSKCSGRNRVTHSSLLAMAVAAAA